MTTKVLQFKLTDDEPVLKIPLHSPSNFVIEGTFGGGTVTHTMSESSKEIRALITAPEAYRCLVEDNTLVLTGSVGANIQVYVEPTKVG